MSSLLLLDLMARSMGRAGGRVGERSGGRASARARSVGSGCGQYSYPPWALSGIGYDTHRKLKEMCLNPPPRSQEAGGDIDDVDSDIDEESEMPKTLCSNVGIVGTSSELASGPPRTPPPLSTTAPLDKLLVSESVGDDGIQACLVLWFSFLAACRSRAHLAPTVFRGHHCQIACQARHVQTLCQAHHHTTT